MCKRFKLNTMHYTLYIVMYTVRCTLYTVQCTICNTNTKNGMSILMLGVILKRRPQGGGRGVFEFMIVRHNVELESKT